MPALLIRNLDAATTDRFRQGAGARSLTQAEFLAALIRLWDSARAHADNGDDSLQAELVALGLQAVER